MTFKDWLNENETNEGLGTWARNAALGAAVCTGWGCNNNAPQTQQPAPQAQVQTQQQDIPINKKIQLADGSFAVRVPYRTALGKQEGLRIANERARSILGGMQGMSPAGHQVNADKTVTFKFTYGGVPRLAQ